MKPIRLSICGWGPYKEKQEIDFTGLERRGLFLITGPTGAGKTTIFDALTYALYGSMSGEMREKTGVRSDFAAVETPTYVELIMSHAGKEYKIYRNPEYLRPRKRSEGFTKEKEKAVLTEPDGKILEGSSEVTRRIQELLRLDYRQFKQLSMIAQGEFARLLSAPPAEKTKIFREIFGTDLYERMASALKGKSSNAYRQVMECRNKMDEDIDILSRDCSFEGEDRRQKWEEFTSSGSYYYEGILEFLIIEEKSCKAKWKQSKEKHEKKEKEVQECTERLAKAQRGQSLFERLETEKARKKELENRKKEMAKEEKRLYSQEAAASLKAEEAKLLSAEEYLKNLEKQMKADEKEITELQDQKEQNIAFYQSREKIKVAYEQRKELETAEHQYRELICRRKEIEVELCKLQETYLKAEEEEENEKQAYEHAEKAYRHGIAGILGEELGENLPCPVCGSVHHPSPAKREAKMPDEKMLRELKQVYLERQQKRIELHAKTAACVSRVDETKKQIGELEGVRKKLRAKEEEMLPFIRNYTAQHTEIQFQKEITAYESALAVLAEKQKKRDLDKREHNLKAENVRQLKAEFADCLKQAGFKKEADYREALTEEGTIGKLRNKIQTYKQQCHANEEMLLHLVKETQNAGKEDVQQLALELKEQQEQKKILLKTQMDLGTLYKSMERGLKSLKEKLVLLNQLMERYSLLKDLDDAANGNNKKRLVFEQYVLAAYFENILNAANIRLRMMSGGRYELRRVSEVTDGRSKDNLEIEVLDYYTGKYRSVKTLSGGESFKASLALALGMSDVVQAGSGGIRVEALFIDEGFGSLDSESVEQACMTLLSLVEKDRLIGIISHVPELSEKIESQIRIQKTSAGSNIEVMVS